MTKHAVIRSKQRMGVKGKKAKRIAQNALERGLGVQDTEGSLQQYIKDIESRENNTQIKIYQEKIFVFSNHGVFITVLYLPKRFKASVINAARKKSQLQTA